MLDSEHMIRQSREMGGALAAAWQQCVHCVQKGCFRVVDMPNGQLLLYYARVPSCIVVLLQSALIVE